MRGGVADQLPSRGDEQRTGGAEGGEDRADAALEQAEGCLDGGGRVALEVATGLTGELGELLAVGLDQVGQSADVVGEGRQQRVAGGVEGDQDAGAAQPGDELGVPVDGHAGRQRARQHGPAGAGGLADQDVGELLAHVGVELEAGLVHLGRGAVRLGQGEVDPHPSGDGHRAVGDLHVAQGQQQRVVVLPGQHRHGQSAGGGDDAGDVDALAARVAGGGQRPLDLTAGQRARQGDRAVEARVRREGDDHATTTSTPSSCRARRSAFAMRSSVMTTSTASIGVKRTRFS